MCRRLMIVRPEPHIQLQSHIWAAGDPAGPQHHGMACVRPLTTRRPGTAQHQEGQQQTAHRQRAIRAPSNTSPATIASIAHQWERTEATRAAVALVVDDDIVG
jgi:hypothetical protein